MKTLFFIISALGLVYLLVSSMDMDSFSFGPEQTVTQKSQAASEDSDLASVELKKVIQDIEVLSLSQRSLQRKLAEVSMVNTQLQDALRTIDQNAAVKPAQTSAGSEVKVQVDAAPRLMNAAKQAENLDTSQAPVLIAQSVQSESEQQKRLRQQAILRDLAQKRQFAAINALQTASGN